MQGILHVDMDAFFAAIEQRDNPDLRSKPVIVGGLGMRGVVATASYEARKYGVGSAMPMAEAKRRCPQGVFLPADHHKYQLESIKLMALLNSFSPLVEPLSLDEAFLDLSGMDWLYQDEVDLARKIKQAIFNTLDLTASVGIAVNKFLAKLASDLQKPDGLVIIRPGEEERILADLPVKKMWGVGKVTAGLLEQMGIMTIGQLASADIKLLNKHFGNSAQELLLLARGLDDRAVVPNHEPKSVSNEITFEHDVTDEEIILIELQALAEKVGWRLRSINNTGYTITIKVRFKTFQTITRSITLPEPSNLDEVIYQAVKQLFEKIKPAQPIRLLGVSVSNLNKYSKQLSLFAEKDNLRRAAVTEAVDSLKTKFGKNIIKRGSLLKYDLSNKHD